MKKFILSLVFCVVCVFGFGIEIFYVSTTGSDSNDGKSWATAFKGVQKAINVASAVATDTAPAQVWIAKGTYYNAGGNAICDSDGIIIGTTAFVMANNVEIYGGFAETESSLEERTSANETILTTEGDYVIFNNRHISSSQLNSSGKLDSVTITGAGEHGIWNCSSNPTITNCTITNNNYGIYNKDSANPIITNCTITNNNYGIYNKDSYLFIKNCTITANGGYGISNYESSSTITNCTITSNGSDGISNRLSSPRLTNCIISDNRGSGIENYGEYNLFASPTIKNCTISGNKGSGICNLNYAAPTVKNCAIINNGSTGITTYNASPIIENCTIVGNSDGIYNYSYASPTITNCTIFSNKGRGVYNIYYWASPTIKNCIIWGNASEEIYIDKSGASDSTLTSNPTVIYSVVEGGYTGTGNIAADPKLGMLGNYGGEVQTIPVLDGSPAIAAGVVDSSVTTDARGFTRSTTPTIGAFEYISPKILTQPQSEIVYASNNVEFSVLASTDARDITYQWQKLNENDEWIDIEGASFATLTLENCQLEQDGTKYRCVVANTVDGVSVISEEVTLTVYPNVTEVTLSTNRITASVGNYFPLSVLHNAYLPTFKWFYSSDMGATWVELEGEVSDSIEFQADSSMNRRQFKCEVTDGGGTTVTSNAAVLVISSSALSITKDISDQVIFIGKDAVLSVTATSTFELSYQWQISKDGGATWENIEGATSSSLTLNAEDYSLSGNLYRCKIDNGGAYIYSSSSTITVFKNVEIVTQPVSTEVYAGKPSSFTVEATGDGNIVYQWQVSSDGELWEDLEGETSATLAFTESANEQNGNLYRVVISNEGNTVTSEVTTLTVYDNLKFSVQPADVSKLAGDEVLFSVEVEAHGEVLYQWQELINEDWVDIENATEASFVIAEMAEEFNGRTFRVVAQNGGDEFISEPATLTYLAPLAIITQPEIIDHAYIGLTIQYTFVTSGDGVSYQWYVSGNFGLDTPVAIEGETSNTLSLVASELLTENVYYCVASNYRDSVTSEMVYLNTTSEATGYQKWVLDSGLTGDNAKPEAKPFNDGITNIEKYAFGLDGTKAASYVNNALFKQTTDGSTATFEFPVNKNATDVTVKALVSEDLKTWTEATATKSGEDGNFDIYKVSQPIPDGGKLFFKLNVEQ